VQLNRGKVTSILQLILTAAFAGLVTATTMTIRSPIPATTGDFNIGDAVIFIVALLFGPAVGGLAGGFGSAVADIIGNPVFAPYTLVIKGMEGWLVGRLSGKTLRSDYFACLIGGGEMVVGYFLIELLLFGPRAALEKLPFDIFQVVAGIALGPMTALLLKRRLPSILSRFSDSSIESSPQFVRVRQRKILFSAISLDKNLSCSIREHLSYHCCLDSLSSQSSHDCLGAFFGGNY